jgi:hypothetical protein
LNLFFNDDKVTGSKLALGDAFIFEFTVAEAAFLVKDPEEILLAAD